MRRWIARRSTISTADRLPTYRQICAGVAREFDPIATFVAKPFHGVSANGCHPSLWTGGERAFDPLGLEGELPGMDEVFTYQRGGRNEFRRESGEWMPTQLIPGDGGDRTIRRRHGLMEPDEHMAACGRSMEQAKSRKWAQICRMAL